MHLYCWIAVEALGAKKIQTQIRTQLEDLKWLMKSNLHWRKSAHKLFLVLISWLWLQEIRLSLYVQCVLYIFVVLNGQMILSLKFIYNDRRVDHLGRFHWEGRTQELRVWVAPTTTFQLQTILSKPFSIDSKTKGLTLLILLPYQVNCLGSFSLNEKHQVIISMLISLMNIVELI